MKKNRHHMLSEEKLIADTYLQNNDTDFQLF